MNTEEIKMVMDMLTTIGAQGKEAFVWFLVFKYGLNYLMWIIGLPAFLFTLYKIIDRLNVSMADAWMQEIRDMIFPNRFSGRVDSREARLTVYEIRKLIEEKKV